LLPVCCQNWVVVTALLPNRGFCGRDIAKRGVFLPCEDEAQRQNAEDAKKDVILKHQVKADGKNAVPTMVVLCVWGSICCGSAQR